MGLQIIGVPGAEGFGGSGGSGGSGAAFGLFRRETDYGAGRVCFAVRSAGACGISCVNARWQGK